MKADVAQPWWRFLGSVLSRWLWPGRCASCSTLLQNEALFCPACELSAALVGWFEPPAQLDAAHAIFVYDGPVASAVRQWKFEAREAVGRAFERCLEQRAAQLVEHLPKRLCVLPVPAHASKVRSRGFDPVWNCARVVAGSLRRHGVDASFEPRTLRRLRATHAQVELDRVEREANLANAFCGRRPRFEDVLLVDDVVTTGATATACARALRMVGAESVRLLALARAAPELDADALQRVPQPHFSEDF